jgi:hypothetical protein
MVVKTFGYHEYELSKYYLEELKQLESIYSYEPNYVHAQSDLKRLIEEMQT